MVSIKMQLAEITNPIKLPGFEHEPYFGNDREGACYCTGHRLIDHGDDPATTFSIKTFKRYTLPDRKFKCLKVVPHSHPLRDLGMLVL